MTNRIQGHGVAVEIGGVERPLRYSLDAIAAVQSALDIEDLSILDEKFFAGLHRNPRRLVAVLWAGLREHWPEARIEEVGRLVTLADIARLTHAVTRALMLSLGTPEEATAGADGVPTEPAGSAPSTT